MIRDDTVGGSTARTRAPLVGRDAELDVLEGALRAVEEQRETRIVSIIGPPGIGKTRLASELVQRARAAGRPAAGRVYRGSARDVAGAYGLFGRLLRARFGLVDGMDKDTARAQVRSQVADVLGDRKVGDVIYFLGQLLGLSFDESPLTRAVQDDPAQVDLVRRAVLKSLLEADAARAPLCLVLDDVHAAHDDSLALLRYLLGCLSGPILVLVAARPELLARQEGWARVGDRRHTVVELRALGDAEATAILEALLAPCIVEDGGKAGPPSGSPDPDRPAVRPGPPSELVEEARAFAGGNPQRLEQMVRIYVEEGVLEDEDLLSDEPRWRVHLDKLASARLPVNAEDAIQARLAALDPARRELLEQAASIGRVFWSGALVVLGRAGLEAPPVWGDGASDLGRVRRVLEELAAQGYVRELPDSSLPGSDEHVFQDDEMREMLRKRASAATKRRYHEATADWLEQQEATRTNDELLALLASHREQVGDAIRAGLAYLEAGDVARARYSNAKAAEHYTKGLALIGASHVARRIDALHHHGDVLYLAGRMDDALAAFREMLTLAWRLDSRSKGGAAHNRIGRLYRDTGALDEAAKHLPVALRLFEAAGDERGVASTIDDIGKLHWLKGEYQTALRWLRDGLARRERMGDRRSIALSLNNLGNALQDSGQFKQALYAFERSLEIRREISDLLGVVGSLNNLGTIAQDQRDFTRALELFREALEVARQVGDRNRTALVLTNIGETCYRSGNPDEAVRVLQQAEEICDELGDKLGLAEALRGLGKAYLLRGDLEKARDSIGRAVDLFAQVRSKVHLGVALRTLGEIAAAGGWGRAHTKSARAYFARSASIFEETGNEVELARTYHAYAKFLTTDRSYASNPATRREAASMLDRAESIMGRLQTSAALIEDEPTAPTEPIRRLSSEPPRSTSDLPAEPASGRAPAAPPGKPEPPPPA